MLKRLFIGALVVAATVLLRGPVATAAQLKLGLEQNSCPSGIECWSAARQTTFCCPTTNYCCGESCCH